MFKAILCFFLGHHYRVIERGVPYIVLECGCCDKQFYVNEYGMIPKESNEVTYD